MSLDISIVSSFIGFALEGIVVFWSTRSGENCTNRRRGGPSLLVRTFALSIVGDIGRVPIIFLSFVVLFCVCVCLCVCFACLSKNCEIVNVPNTSCAHFCCSLGRLLVQVQFLHRKSRGGKKARLRTGGSGQRTIKTVPVLYVPRKDGCSAIDQFDLTELTRKKKNKVIARIQVQVLKVRSISIISSSSSIIPPSTIQRQP